LTALVFKVVFYTADSGGYCENALQVWKCHSGANTNWHHFNI